MIEFLFAALPIAVLIVLMTKPNPLPATVAFFLAAALALIVRFVYFRTTFPLLGAAVIAGLLEALTPIAIVFGAIFFFVALEKSGAMDCLAGMAPRHFEQPCRANHAGWLGLRFPYRRRLRIRHSCGAGGANSGRARVSGDTRGLAVPDFQCDSDRLWRGGHADVVCFEPLELPQSELIDIGLKTALL